MQLEFPDALRDRLRKIHRTQRAVAPGSSSRVERAFPEGAVFLWSGMGYEKYLTLSGHVIGTSPDDSPPYVVDDLRAVANILVRGAREQELPELVALLPGPPAGCTTCRACHGQRWNTTVEPGYPDGSVCWYCSGLGWQTEAAAQYLNEHASEHGLAQED